MERGTLNDIFEKRKSNFYSVIEFIVQHKDLKQNCNRFFNSSLFAHTLNAKEKLRIMYIDSISAAGGNNLTRNGESCKKFYKQLAHLPESPKIKMEAFYKCFDEEVSSFNDLFFHLGDSYLNFGNKKSALFLNKINWVQLNIEEEERIFINYEVDNMELMVPVDNVITFVLNKVLFKYSGIKLDQYRDFILINDFFKEKLGDNFMIIEDLWFWGFFSTIGNIKDRKLEFNEDKFYTAKYLKPTKQHENTIKDFIRIVKE